MSTERPEESSHPAANSNRPTAAGQRDSDAGRDSGERGSATQAAPNDATHHDATIVVRGATVHDQDQESATTDSRANEKEPPPRKEVSEAKARLQHRLPGLDDDADAGAQKERIVVRDGKADLAFTGTLLASAAPEAAPDGHWQEYRIYQTSAGKHVFSKVNRSIFVTDQDGHEAEVFDPSPSSVPSQLLRSARDLTRSRPITWMDAAVDFFGYDPLAKALYRKLGGRFEEHIS